MGGNKNCQSLALKVLIADYTIQMSRQERKDFAFLKACYWTLSVGVGVLVYLGRGPTIWRYFQSITSSRTDPVLSWLIFIIGLLAALCLVPGVLIVILIAFAIVFVLSAIALFFVMLWKLALMSPTGFVLAIILVGFTLIGAVRWLRSSRFGLKLEGWLRLAFDTVFGIFFEWWLTPILLRRKEKRIMDDVKQKRERYEQAAMKLLRECPQIADIPISIAPETWLANVAERFRQRQTEKTFQAQTKMLEQVKLFFSEFRAALDAQDNLGRAKAEFTEKDAEAELRVREREIRELTFTLQGDKLRDEIDQHKEKVARRKNPPPQPKMPSKMERIAEMKQAKARDHAAFAGDSDLQGMSDREWDDKIFRVMQGRE